jgi:hypothetical protein
LILVFTRSVVCAESAQGRRHCRHGASARRPKPPSMQRNAAAMRRCRGRCRPTWVVMVTTQELRRMHHDNPAVEWSIRDGRWWEMARGGAEYVYRNGRADTRLSQIGPLAVAVPRPVSTSTPPSISAALPLGGSWRRRKLPRTDSRSIRLTRNV